MTPTGDGPPIVGTPDRAKSRRWLRITLGSLLAFIAGMAVMLAVLLPFTPWARRPAIADPHAGMAAVQGVTPQNCTTCHATVPGNATPSPGLR